MAPEAEEFAQFTVDLWLNDVEPAVLLRHLVDRLDAPAELDDDLCMSIGCGSLESLLRDHEVELWPELERLARANPRFRRALAAVWAYDSPAYEWREALLIELDAAD